MFSKLYIHIILVKAHQAKIPKILIFLIKINMDFVFARIYFKPSNIP